MTRTDDLRKWISEKGIKLTSIASAMGISIQCLLNKLNNKTEFKASEIFVFTSKFGMTVRERDFYFFAIV